MVEHIWRSVVVGCMWFRPFHSTWRKVFTRSDPRRRPGHVRSPASHFAQVGLIHQISKRRGSRQPTRLDGAWVRKYVDALAARLSLKFGGAWSATVVGRGLHRADG